MPATSAVPKKIVVGILKERCMTTTLFFVQNIDFAFAFVCGFILPGAAIT